MRRQRRSRRIKKGLTVLLDRQPFYFGPGEMIRTSDPYNPIVVRYQTAPRPEDTTAKLLQEKIREPSKQANTRLSAGSCQRGGLATDLASFAVSSALQQLQNLLELDTQLANDLLALGVILFCSFAGQLLARAADGEALLI